MSNAFSVFFNANGFSLEITVLLFFVFIKIIKVYCGKMHKKIVEYEMFLLQPFLPPPSCVSSIVSPMEGCALF